MYAYRFASLDGCKSTPLASTASAITSIQPSNVATWNKAKYAIPTWSKDILEFIQEKLL